VTVAGPLGSKPSAIVLDPGHYVFTTKANKNVMLNYIVDVPRSGRYIFAIDYISDRNFPNSYYINLKLKNNPDSETSVLLYPCLYSTICRTSVNDNGMEKSFYISKDDLQPVVIYVSYKFISTL